MNNLHTIKYATADDPAGWRYHQYWVNFIRDTIDMNGKSYTSHHVMTRLKEEYQAVWHEFWFEIDFEREEDMVMFVLRYS